MRGARTPTPASWLSPRLSGPPQPTVTSHLQHWSCPVSWLRWRSSLDRPESLGVGSRGRQCPHPEHGGDKPGCRHWAGRYLVLLRALRELPELGIELREAPRDPLDAGVQVSVLAVLGVEVVFVALPLLRGGDGGVFSGEMEERGHRGLGGCSREPGSVHSHVASPAQEAAPTRSSWAIRNTQTAMGSSQRTRVHTHRSTHTATGSSQCTRVHTHRSTHTAMGSSQRTRVHTHRSTHTATGSVLPQLTCRAGGRGSAGKGSTHSK